MNTSKNRILALSLTSAITLASSFSVKADTLEQMSFGSDLVDAAESGDVSKVEGLIYLGSSPNEKGEFDTTPLMRAAYHGNLDMVKLLIKNGANPNIQDIGGATALHIASREGQLEVVKFLTENGAKLDLADKEGNTPLMKASSTSKTEVVAALLKKGADSAKKNKFGETAVAQAKENNDEEVVASLTQAPIDAQETTVQLAEAKPVEAKKSSKLQIEVADIEPAAGTPAKAVEVAKAENIKITPVKVVEKIRVINPTKDSAAEIAAIKSAPKLDLAQIKPVAKPAKLVEEDEILALVDKAESEAKIAKVETAKTESKKEKDTTTINLAKLLTPKPEVVSENISLDMNKPTDKPKELAVMKVEKQQEIALVDDKDGYVQIPEKNSQAILQQLKKDNIVNAKDSVPSEVPAKDWLKDLKKVYATAGEGIQVASVVDYQAGEAYQVLDFGSFPNQEFAVKRAEEIKKSSPALADKIAIKVGQKKLADKTFFTVTGGVIESKDEALNICKQIISSGINCRPIETRLLTKNQFEDFKNPGISVNTPAPTAKPSDQAEAKTVENKIEIPLDSPEGKKIPDRKDVLGPAKAAEVASTPLAGTVEEKPLLKTIAEAPKKPEAKPAQVAEAKTPVIPAAPKAPEKAAEKPTPAPTKVAEVSPKITPITPVVKKSSDAPIHTSDVKVAEIKAPIVVASAAKAEEKQTPKKVEAKAETKPEVKPTPKTIELAKAPAGLPPIPAPATKQPEQKPEIKKVEVAKVEAPKPVEAKVERTNTQAPAKTFLDMPPQKTQEAKATEKTFDKIEKQQAVSISDQKNYNFQEVMKIVQSDSAPNQPKNSLTTDAKPVLPVLPKQSETIDSKTEVRIPQKPVEKASAPIQSNVGNNSPFNIAALAEANKAQLPTPPKAPVLAKAETHRDLLKTAAVSEAEQEPQDNTEIKPPKLIDTKKYVRRTDKNTAAIEASKKELADKEKKTEKDTKSTEKKSEKDSAIKEKKVEKAFEPKVIKMPESYKPTYLQAPQNVEDKKTEAPKSVAVIPKAPEAPKDAPIKLEALKVLPAPAAKQEVSIAPKAPEVTKLPEKVEAKQPEPLKIEPIKTLAAAPLAVEEAPSAPEPKTEPKILKPIAMEKSVEVAKPVTISPTVALTPKVEEKTVVSSAPKELPKMPEAQKKSVASAVSKLPPLMPMLSPSQNHAEAKILAPAPIPVAQQIEVKQHTPVEVSLKDLPKPMASSETKDDFRAPSKGLETPPQLVQAVKVEPQNIPTPAPAPIVTQAPIAAPVAAVAAPTTAQVSPIVVTSKPKVEVAAPAVVPQEAGKFEVARPIRVTSEKAPEVVAVNSNQLTSPIAPAPQPNSTFQPDYQLQSKPYLAKEYWIRAGNFNSPDHARNFWHSLLAQYAPASGYTMKTLSSVTRGGKITANIGPFYDTQSIAEFCTVIRSGGFNCEYNAAIGSQMNYSSAASSSAERYSLDSSSELRHSGAGTSYNGNIGGSGIRHSDLHR